MTVAATEAAYAGSKGAGINASLTVGTTWYGNYMVGGSRVYCAAQTGADAPDEFSDSVFGSTVWLNGSTGGSWTSTWDLGTPNTLWTGSGIVAAKQSGTNLDQSNTSSRVQDGRTLTGRNLNRIGYVLARYGNTTSNTTASRVAMLIKEKFDVLHSTVWENYLNTNSGAEAANRAAIDTMWDNAIDFAGPYDTAPGLTVTVNGAGDGGTVTGIGLYSDTNNLVPGVSWTAQILSTNAVWNSTGTRTRTGTSTTALQSAGFTATGSGNVRVQITYTGVPDWRVGVRRNSQAAGQDIFLGRTLSLSAIEQSDQPVQDFFTISVETQTSAAIATPGEELTDDMTVSLIANAWTPANHPIVITSTLYGPFATQPTEQDSVPPGAPVVGSVTTTVTEPGTYTTPGLTVTAPGYYVWHETSPADEFVGAWSGRFAVASETSLVAWTPAVSTTISSGVFRPGDAVSDSVNLTGAQPGSTVTVNGTLFYAPGAEAPIEAAEIPADAVVAGTSSTTITADGSGNGTGTLPAVTIPSDALPGYYTWVVSTVASDANLAYTSNFAVAEETGLFPWQPQIATTISSSTLEVGTDVSDNVSVVGGRPGETITVTGTLYRDAGASAPSQSAAVPGDATAVGTTTVDVTFDGDGNASAVLPAVDHGDVPGYYTWVVSTPATATMDAYTSDYGIPAETGMLAWRPEISTTISSSTFSTGTPVSDSVNITGGRPGETVTVTGTLYRDAGTSAPTQSGTVPVDATEVGTTTVDVTLDSAGSGSADLPGVDHGDVPGYYTWVVSTPASATMEAYTSDYGIPGESGMFGWNGFAITRAAHVETLVTGFDPDSGLPAGTMTLSDEVMVDGLPADFGAQPGESTPITVDLYFVHHSEVSSLSQLDTMCTADNLMASTTVDTLNGTHTAASSDFEVPIQMTDDNDGYYMFVHHYPGSTRVGAFQGTCAEGAETLYLTPSAMVEVPVKLSHTGPDDSWRTLVALSGLLIAGGVALAGFTRYGVGHSGARHVRGRRTTAAH
ncbi:hypothetical protein [Demequina sp.]|uniref:hypothetical protein n=1 Tax=Demequina sp. TaxID=2050685 RepID=UPI003D0FC30C